MGHLWLFKTEWLRYLWADNIPSWDVAEDLAFSAQAWLKGRIKTLVIRQSPFEYEVLVYMQTPVYNSRLTRVYMFDLCAGLGRLG